MYGHFACLNKQLTIKYVLNLRWCNSKRTLVLPYLLNASNLRDKLLPKSGRRFYSHHESAPPSDPLYICIKHDLSLNLFFLHYHICYNVLFKCVYLQKRQCFLYKVISDEESHALRGSMNYRFICRHISPTDLGCLHLSISMALGL